MQIPIITAIITTAGSALTAVLTLYVKNFIETRGDKTIAYSRRKALKGFWKGHFIQEGISYLIEMEIEANQKKVFGDGRSYHDNVVHKFSFTGAFKNDRFLKLEYQNKDSNVINFGTIVLELSALSKTLSGRYVGYGHINERILDGKMILDKN